MGTRDGSADPLADPRVFLAVQAYQAERDAGRHPDHAEFAARYPAVADALVGCLRGFDFVWQAAPRVTHSGSSTDFAAATAGSRLGDFRVLREIGRGGMGVVYEAEQVSLGRRVALKVLSVPVPDDRARRRFHNEAHAAASLSHPHVVPVYAVGADGDTLFLAMKLVEGRSLAELLRPTPGSPDGAPLADPDATVPCTLPPPATADDFHAVARLGRQAAEALQHAHDSGIVHRDVKPGNLLLESNGHLWVADFGLARVPGAGDLTRTGEMVGTLRYVSPEQAAGRAVDHRTDVYSLGVTLYELATRRPAFPGTDPHDLLRRVADSEPPAPRAVAPAVPRDLETVILKAMAKEPAERYATAADLAADLGRFLDDRTVLASRPTALDRARKWVRRHRALVRGAAAAAFVLLALVAGGIAVSAEQLAGEKKVSDKLNGELTAAVAVIGEQKRDADALNTDLRTAVGRRDAALGSANFQLARRDWAAGDFARATARLDLCPPGERPWEWHYLDGCCRDPATLRDLGGNVTALAFDPAADRVVVATRVLGPRSAAVLRCFAGTAGAATELWSVPTADRGVEQIVFGPNGRWVATADNIQSDHVVDVTVHDPATGRATASLPLTGVEQVYLTCAPDGACVAAVVRAGGVEVWDVAANRVRTRFPLPKGTVHGGGGWSPDGLRLAVPVDATTRVIDTATGRALLTLASGRVIATAFSPDGRRLATANESNTVRVWDLLTGTEVATHTTPGDLIVRLAYSPDGQRLLGGGRGGIARVWVADRGPEAAAYRGHAGRVLAVAFHPDGVRAATGGWDGTVRVLNTLDPSEGRWCPGLVGLVLAGVSEDGSLVAARALGAAATELRLLDLATGRPRGVIGVARASHSLTVFRPDGARVAVADGDGPVRVWDVAAGREVGSWNLGPHQTWALAYSADGRLLAAAGPESLRVFAADDGRLLQTFPGRFPSGDALAFRPDGRLAAGQSDGSVRVWEAETGRPVHHLTGHDRAVVAVRYSPDGTLLVSGDAGGATRLWDGDSGRLVRALPGNGGAVTSVAFTPDGRRFATAGNDLYVRVWDTASGEECLAVRTPTAPTRVRFDARGEVLTALTSLGPIRWRAGRPLPDWTTAPDHVAAWHRDGARSAEQARDWPRAAWHLDRLGAPDGPGRVRLAVASMRAAVAFGEVGDWPRAAALSARAVANGFDVTDLEAHGWQPVWLRVYLGDAAERRRTGTALVERHRDSTNPRTLQLAARMAVLRPDGLDDPAAAVRVARRSTERDAKNPFLWLTLALAEYRAGDADAALAAVRQAIVLRPDVENLSETDLVVALAEARRGNRAEAVRRLNRTGGAIDQDVRTGLGGAFGREEVGRLREEVAARTTPPAP